MAFTTSQSTVSELFQASFGRAVSSVSALDAWVVRFDAKDPSTAERDILAEMNLSAESSTVYSGNTDAQTVDLIFTNSLGRAAEEPGRQAWIDRAATIDLDQLQQEILAAARGNADSTFLDGQISDAEALLTPDSTFTLTVGSDIRAGTTGNDTFTAEQTTLTAGDVITDGSSVDNDTLNVALTAANTVPTVVAGIENVNFNLTSFANVTVDADGIVGSGTTITVNNLQTAGTTQATVTNVGSGATVVAGTGVSTVLDVTAAASGTSITVDGGSAATVTADLTAGTEESTITANTATTVNVGNIVAASISSTSATAVNVEGTAAATDSVTVSAVNSSATTTVALNTNSDGTGTDQVENLTLSGNGGAVTYVLNASDAIETVTFTGTEDVTLSLLAADITTETVTDSTTGGTTTVQISTTGGTADLTKVAADVIDINAGDTGTYTVINGQSVKATAALTSVTIDSTTLTTGDENLSLAIEFDQASTTVVSDFETVNLSIALSSADGNSSTATGAVTAGATSVVNVTGSVATTWGAITADTINAATYSGNITHTVVDTVVDTVTYGTGDDAITATTADTLTLDGGAGTDTLTTGANSTGVTFSNFEVVTLGADTDFKVSQLSGQTFIVNGSQGIELDDGTANAIDSTTIDLSGLIIDTSQVTGTTIVVDASTISTSIALGNSFTVSGTAVVDNVTLTDTVGSNTVSTGAGADIVLGGTGVDTITVGEGADAITGGLGADIINLAETTAATDTVTLTTGGALDVVTINDFLVGATNGDIIEISLADVDALTGNLQLAGNGAATAAVDGTPTVTVAAVGAFDLGAVATSDMIAFDGDYATVAAFEAALEVGGTSALTAGGIWTAGDSFLVAFDDGVDTSIGYITTAAGAADNATFVADDLTFTNVVTLTGVTDATAFLTNNIDIVT